MKLRRYKDIAECDRFFLKVLVGYILFSLLCMFFGVYGGIPLCLISIFCIGMIFKED